MHEPPKFVAFLDIELVDLGIESGLISESGRCLDELPSEDCCQYYCVDSEKGDHIVAEGEATQEQAFQEPEYEREGDDS